MSENNTHPLTEDRAAELWDAHVPLVLNFRVWTWGDRSGILDALRAAYNAGRAEWKANAEAAAERAERAEDKLSDSVHVDEAARRVEAAREQGWDDAADWVKRREAWSDEELRAANPHRPAPSLPTEDGAVIIPADGHEFIAMTDAEGWVFGGWAFDRMTYSAEHDRWYGMTTRGAIAMCSAEQITPGAWRAV